VVKDAGAGLLVGLMLDRARRLRQTPVPSDVLETLVDGLPGHVLSSIANAPGTQYRLVRGHHTGRSIYELARETPCATARAFFGARTAEWAHDLRIRRPAGPTLEELRTPSVSSQDRNFFLETVAREGAQR
jgi:hypothetical protein